MTLPAAQACKLLTAGDELLVRPVGLGCAGYKMQAHLGAADHQAVAHVVAGIAHVSEFQPGQLAKVLFDRQKVSQNLGGVELIGQAIPYRYTCMLRKLLNIS